MPHLTLEEIARLVDELPEPAEAAHLDACEECSAELDLMREQTATLTFLPDAELPPAIWAGVEQRLRAEGLMRAPAGGGVGGSPWMRYAAGVVLLLIGAAGGSALSGGGSDAPIAAASPAESSPARMAGNQQPATAGDAVREAEAAYLRALANYTEQNAGGLQFDPAARLAALESILLTTRAALSQAPADPVINGYYLTAAAQRDAMMRQVSAPADTTWF